MKLSHKEQLELIKINDGKILTAVEIRKLFSYSKSTAIIDVWLFAEQYIVEAGRSKYDGRTALYKIVYNKTLNLTGGQSEKEEKR